MSPRTGPPVPPPRPAGSHPGRAGDAAWRCPSGVSAPDPSSPSTFCRFPCFCAAFPAAYLVSRASGSFPGPRFIWPVVSWSSSLALWVRDKRSRGFGCPVTHAVARSHPCVVSCCFRGCFAEGGPNRRTPTQYYCTV